MVKRWHVLAIGLAIAMVVLAQGAPTGGSGGVQNGGTVSSGLTVSPGTLQTANIQLDGGSKACFGSTGDCQISIARSAANTLTVTADTATLFSGAVQAGTGQFTAPPAVPLDLAGKAANGAGAIGIKLSNINALSTEGAAIAALYSDYATTKEAYVDKDGVYATNAAEMAGQITMSSGTGTATVKTGSICTCVNATDTTAWGCSVSGTTLTATGTGSDVISYICVIKF